jgi:hypothetical protein
MINYDGEYLLPMEQNSGMAYSCAHIRLYNLDIDREISCSRMTT